MALLRPWAGLLDRITAAWTACLAVILTRLLQGPNYVQTFLLSIPRLEDAIIGTLSARYAEAVQQCITQPSTSLDTCPYHVDAAAKQTLLFSALAALSTHLQSEEVLAPSQLLPQVSRVLLTTQEPHADKFLEAVAASLAGQMHAGLLKVDAMLLATLCSATLGGSPEAHLTLFSGGRVPSSSRRDSSLGAKDQATLRLGWRALREALFQLERPTVVYVKRAEVLLASSQDAYDAYQEVFGQQEAMALEGATSRAPLVLLGGLSQDESAAARTGARSPAGAAAGAVTGGSEEEEEEEGGFERSRRPKAGLDGLGGLGGDEELGLAELLSGLSLLAAKPQPPDPRKLLLKLFPTRVKLLKPPPGPLAVQHQQQIEQDAAQQLEEDSYRAAAAVAASTGVSIPPKASGIYAGSASASASASASKQPMRKPEWRKVLSWAVAMETLQAKQRQLQLEQQQEEAAEGDSAAEQAVPNGAAALEPAGSTGSSTGQTPLSAAGLRRRRGLAAPDAAQAAAPPANGKRAHMAGQLLPSPLSLAGSLWRVLNPLHLAAAAVALPWHLGAAAASGTARLARVCVCRLPLVGGAIEDLLTVLESSQLEAELAELEAELAALDLPGDADSLSLEADVDGLGGGDSGHTGGGATTGTLQLSEASVRYGLSMLQRSSPDIKQSVRPSNSYERQLLAEVLSPEECGRGFSEVGALAEAKTALREAVQLPLQHPQLFAGGTLARPSKGVLLFGPPGTGKTMVARAAAAECGATFLSLSPSSLTSKYLGDSVKLVRAAFTLAAKLAPCVLFIDEVDSLLGRRNSSKEHEALRELKNEFTMLWDGVRTGRERVMVLGATNRPFDIDEAALRRFTHRILVGLPDKAARQAILRVVLEGEKLAADVDVVKLAERTEGYSGSDLRQLCVAAAMRPVRSFLEHTAAADDAAGSAEAAAEQAVTAQAGAEERVTAGAGVEQAAAELVLPEHAPAMEAAAAAARPGADSAGANQASAGAPAVPAVHSRCASLASSSGQAQAPSTASPAATGAARSIGGSSARDSAATASLRMMPQLDSLLRQADDIARQPANPTTELRAVTMQDFEGALREVSPSVDPESATVKELAAWDKQWGSLGNRGGMGKRLSYFT